MACLILIWFIMFSKVFWLRFQFLFDSTVGRFKKSLTKINLQFFGFVSRSSPRSQTSQFENNSERFSRKVFVGGLPPDIDEGI